MEKAERDLTADTQLQVKGRFRPGVGGSPEHVLLHLESWKQGYDTGYSNLLHSNLLGTAKDLFPV